MAQAVGRAGQVSITGGNDPVQIIGIAAFLRDAAKADERFNTEMRKAAQQVAENLNEKAKAEAATVTRSRQATEVMKGMRARRDRIPTIKLSEKSKRKVTRGDVFFGAEFGGGARPTTRQFLRHRGRRVTSFGLLCVSIRQILLMLIWMPSKRSWINWQILLQISLDFGWGLVMV
jgi:hypothetical protein